MSPPPRQPPRPAATATRPKLVRDGPDLHAWLAAGDLAPLVVITSGQPDERPTRRDQDPPAADPWALQAATAAVEAAALKGGDANLDHARVDYIDGDHQGAGVHQVIASEARSMSLFGGRRVVTVVHAGELAWGGAASTGARRKKKKASADPLETLVEGIGRDDRADFVLIFVASRIDRRKKAWKQVLSRAVEVAVAPLNPARLQRYLTDSAAPFKVRVDRDVAQKIWDRLGGSDPARLRQTADRLLLDVGPGGHLTRARVEEVVPIDREAAVFAITDALAQEDLPRAFAVVHLLLHHGTTPLAMVGFLASHYRGMMRVGAGIAAGQGDPDIARTTRLHPYRVKLMREQLRRTRRGRVEQAVASLAEADRVLKSSKLGDREAANSRWMEQLVLALARGERLRVPTPPTVTRLL